MIYQVIIEARDPVRFVPPSWNIEADDDAHAWHIAIKLGDVENVGIIKVLDDRGREVPSAPNVDG